MSKTAHEELLEAIRSRQQKSTEFNGGILTADRYVRTIPECVGSDLCYRFAAKGNISFDDIIKKSTLTLTYNNPEMVIEDLYGKSYDLHDEDGESIELPKNTLMVFKHVLTTPKKDRDGDIMRTQGARPDPKMLLLWQHVHTLPIGKMLHVYEHNSKRLGVYSAIVDMNDLCHDSAVMVENKMGRFSHGFKALEFEKVKHEGNHSPGGFDVKAFEIMEESLVSVPSNTDAETEEVLLSLVEGGKLTSPLMKGIGKNIRTKRDKSVAVPLDIAGLKVPITLDLNLQLNGKAFGNDSTSGEPEETKSGCTGEAGCDCGCGKSGSSEKADADTDTGEKGSDKEMTCPKCGSSMKNGICEKCGYGLKEDDQICEKCGSTMKGGVCEKCSPSKKKDEEKSITAQEAMSIFLTKSTKDERVRMKATLTSMEEVDRVTKETSDFKKFVGKTKP